MSWSHAVLAKRFKVLWCQLKLSSKTDLESKSMLPMALVAGQLSFAFVRSISVSQRAFEESSRRNEGLGHKICEHTKICVRTAKKTPCLAQDLLISIKIVTDLRDA